MAERYIAGERQQLTLDFSKTDDAQDEKDLRIDALDIILATGRATTAQLTRRLKVASYKAAEIMAELEDAGIVGPSNGDKNARDINISDKAEGLEKLNMVAAQ